MLTIVGPFLERSQIRQIFSPNFILLQQHLSEELARCKYLFESQLTRVMEQNGKSAIYIQDTIGIVRATMLCNLPLFTDGKWSD